jgi:5'-deoxynucleotidase YfbR-like HD superfamily hydrolase
LQFCRSPLVTERGLLLLDKPVDAASVPTAEQAPRTFGRMLSGRLLHLLDPSPLDLDLNDLLIGISRVNRWCGQTIGEVGFNVAHHSCLVEQILCDMVWPGAPWEVRRWALSHDLAEAVYGDVVTPVKAVLGDRYRELEGRLERALCLVLGIGSTVPAEWRRSVKRADRIAAVTEAVRLAGWTEKEARKLVGMGYRGKLWQGPLDPWPEQEARAQWITRFRAVGGKI